MAVRTKTFSTKFFVKMSGKIAVPLAACLVFFACHRSKDVAPINRPSSGQRIDQTSQLDPPKNESPTGLSEKPQTSAADTITWIKARRAWDLLRSGEALLLDFRNFEEYERKHLKAAVSFSRNRIVELETAFPDKRKSYILTYLWADELTKVVREFRKRGYGNLFGLNLDTGGGGSAGDPRNDWEREGLPEEGTSLIEIGNTLIIPDGYDLFCDSLGNWKRVGRFPVPTVRHLLQYRAHVIDHFFYDTTKYKFYEMVGDVRSSISTTQLTEGKVWVGFSYYEGEGYEGYGGIGFCDLLTHEVGVLRHPALLDHSVRSLLVTDTAFFAATIDHFELTVGVGNGLLIIDRRTLEATALVPPGTSVLWDKDSDESCGRFYDKSIIEILNDGRLVQKDVEQFSNTELESIRKFGLEQYMIHTAVEERRLRDEMLSKGLVRIDSIIVLDWPPMVVADTAWRYRPIVVSGYGHYLMQTKCSKQGYAGVQITLPSENESSQWFDLRPRKHLPTYEYDFSPVRIPEKGFIWYGESAAYSSRIELLDLKFDQIICDMGKATEAFEIVSYLKLRALMIELSY